MARVKAPERILEAGVVDTSVLLKKQEQADAISKIQRAQEVDKPRES